MIDDDLLQLATELAHFLQGTTEAMEREYGESDGTRDNYTLIAKFHDFRIGLTNGK